MFHRRMRRPRLTEYDKLQEILYSPGLINYCQDKKLLSRIAICSCGRDMQLQPHAASVDACAFKCAHCKTTKSLRTGSMFADSPLPLDRILQTCLSFIQGTPVGVCASMFGLSESTVVDWYALCGKVCSKALLREASSPLGGPGVEMQVDEFLLKKYEFGIGSPESQDWLIGMYDTAQRRAVFERVEDRRADCLIPVIRKWIAVGSVVVTDDWEGYHSLTSLGYKHTAIKRSKNFVDPVTGKHMNGVKAYWSNLKKRVRRSEPVNERNIWSHLEEAKYRKWYGLKSDIFPAWDLFVSHIAQLYPVEENPALQSP